jgi:hypothetical protein
VTSEAKRFPLENIAHFPEMRLPALALSRDNRRADKRRSPGVATGDSLLIDYFCFHPIARGGKILPSANIQKRKQAEKNIIVRFKRSAILRENMHFSANEYGIQTGVVQTRRVKMKKPAMHDGRASCGSVFAPNR